MRASMFTLLVAAAPALAVAEPAEQKAEGVEPAKTESAAPAAQDSRFKIKRGFFAEGDLGLFMTFGGRNTNDPGTATGAPYPSRGISNVQPHLGVTVGYDLVHGASWNFALGLKLGMGFNGGAGRATEADIAADADSVGTRPADFAVIETGVQAAMSFLITDRIAITPKLDVGAGFLDPDPTKPAIITSAGGCPEGSMLIMDTQSCSVGGSGTATFAPIFGVGVGVEYFTLLNDFSVGVDLRFAGILKDGLIPAISATFPIKYTF